MRRYFVNQTTGRGRTVDDPNAEPEEGEIEKRLEDQVVTEDIPLFEDEDEDDGADD